jgi:hypothetical protein
MSSNLQALIAELNSRNPDPKSLPSRIHVTPAPIPTTHPRLRHTRAYISAHVRARSQARTQAHTLINLNPQLLSTITIQPDKL